MSKKLFKLNDVNGNIIIYANPKRKSLIPPISLIQARKSSVYLLKTDYFVSKFTSKLLNLYKVGKSFQALA